MEEEDGRPGPGARQSGSADVLPDALVESLCQPIQTRKPIAQRDSFVDLRADAHVPRIQVQKTEEKSYENVPGK